MTCCTRRLASSATGPSLFPASQRRHNLRVEDPHRRDANLGQHTETLVGQRLARPSDSVGI
jgi:hypothetical protein